MYISQYFIYFIIYSFIGWAYETIICSLPQKKFINRGFLNSPLCPIYGFGALLAIFTLYGHTDSLIIIFFVSMFLSTILEYFTSWLMEKLFHMRWWDYTGRPFNIKGRVFLLGAIVFATLCVILIFFAHPFIEFLIIQAPASLINWLALTLAALIVTDTCITTFNLLKLNRVLSEIQKNFNDFVDFQVERSISLRDNFFAQFRDSEFYSDKIKNLILEIHRRQLHRFSKVFPHSSSVKYTEAWKSTKLELKTKPPKQHLSKKSKKPKLPKSSKIYKPTKSSQSSKHK